VIDTPTAPSTDLLTVSRVCDRLPGKTGGHVAKSTVTRWIIDGCPARDGTRVRLTATRAGSRWPVAPADLDAFFAALAVLPSSPAPPTRTHTDLRTAAVRAAEALARRGA
jgi:hypothetical protein